MNSKLKGAIAAGAATVLLAGGAGTMAAWNSGASIGGGAVGAGALALTQTVAPNWADQHGPITVTDFRAVPGDVLTYTASFEVTARGTNLRASLAVDEATIVGDPAFESVVDHKITATSGGDPVPVDSDGVVVTPALDGATVDVKVIITFAADTDGDAAQNVQVDLSNFNVTLRQV
ncbi:alternate-type signal peptide domain-containing protein [Rhodococcus spongiicola]|uniref:alternate-type signal peptide domain-containing protein n=1 Tax=Rhodococcus spongiicola TaxID=2487352 RepID=UPI001F16FBBB|nr:alternate-type signal peptide domain-containing protein [Rhodococcus spongiicola]